MNFNLSPKKKHFTVLPLISLIFITGLLGVSLIQEVEPQREGTSFYPTTASKNDEKLLKIHLRDLSIVDGARGKVLFLTKLSVNDPMILWIFDINTQKKEMLAELKTAVIEVASFSPDARFIVYITSDARTSLLKVNRLETGKDLLSLERPVFAFDNLRWSPDGRFLAYEDGKDVKLLDTLATNEPKVNPIGEGVKELEGKIIYYPLWVDVSHFLFLARLDTNDYLTKREADVWIANVEGTTLEKLTTAYDGSIDWSLFYFTKGRKYYEPSLHSLYSKPILTANSKYLIYVKASGTPQVEQTLWKLDLASKEVEQLKFPWQSFYTIAELSLSPDGHYLAYTTFSAKNLLNLLNLQNGESNILAEHPDDIFSHYHWSSDSRYLIYDRGIIDISEIKASFQEDLTVFQSEQHLPDKTTYSFINLAHLRTIFNPKKSYSPLWVEDKKDKKAILFLVRPVSGWNDDGEIATKATLYLFNLQSEEIQLIARDVDAIDWWRTLY